MFNHIIRLIEYSLLALIVYGIGWIVWAYAANALKWAQLYQGT